MSCSWRQHAAAAAGLRLSMEVVGGYSALPSLVGSYSCRSSSVKGLQKVVWCPHLLRLYYGCKWGSRRADI